MDEGRRISFYKKLLTLQATIGMDVLISNTLTVNSLIDLSLKDSSELNTLLEDSYYSSKVRDNKNKELSIKKHLWSILKPKLDELYLDDLIKFYEMACGIFTMDALD